jgi:S-DNA-T family DNA segregation ATPase FtsK/SpoIIIE
MANDRIIRNDMVAVGLLGLIVFLVAAVATYDPADPAHEVPQLLIKIYQPDQLVYPTNPSFHNACGRLGAWTADMLLHVLGVGVYFLIAGLIAMEIALFRREPTETPWLKSIGWGLALLGITTLGSMLLPDWTVAPLIGAGGYLGALSRGLLMGNIGSMGCLVGGIALTVVGMMMWTEYLIFTAGRVAFSPAMLAASAVLPFGLVHGFMQWFNGEEDEYEDEEYEEDEDEDQASQGDELDDETISEEERRTIRFRRRENDAEVFDEIEIGGDGHSTAAVATLDDAEEDDQQWEEELEDVVATIAAEKESEDELEDDQEEDEQEYEEDEVEEEDQPAAPASLNIKNNTSKTPIPAIAPAGEDEILRTDQPATQKSKPHFKTPGKKEAPSERDLMISQLDAASLVDNAADYELPPLEMLEAADSLPFEQQKREALIKAEILEKTCKQFGFVVKVVEIETGPVISQYEIDLEPGLRLQKIVALADDLAIAMRVPRWSACVASWSSAKNKSRK